MYVSHNNLIYSIRIPFKYYPRTRAHLPIVPSPGFFSTIKTSPEEWFQATAVVRARPHSRLEPLQTQVSGKGV
jgi:hypothetical protein